MTPETEVPLSHIDVATNATPFNFEIVAKVALFPQEPLLDPGPSPAASRQCN